jgi:hypothetical protein
MHLAKQHTTNTICPLAITRHVSPSENVLSFTVFYGVCPQRSYPNTRPPPGDLVPEIAIERPNEHGAHRSTREPQEQQGSDPITGEHPGVRIQFYDRRLQENVHENYHHGQPSITAQD